MDNQNIVKRLSGSKRKAQEEFHSFDRPAAKAGPRGRGSDEDNFNITEAKSDDVHSDGRDGGNDVWSEEQHKNFVSSIFEIGLKTASPAIILENMTQRKEMITSDRVKSKLQKYRSKKNKEKSKQEFIRNYCEFLQRVKSIQATARTGACIGHRHLGVVDGVLFDPILSKLLEDINGETPGHRNILSGGDIAGYLAYSVMEDYKKTKNIEGKSIVNGNTSATVRPINLLRKGAKEFVENNAGCAIHFPVLTNVEKKSPLGIAMTFIAGLFLTMSQQLTEERKRAETIGLKLSFKALISDTNAPGDDTVQKNR